MPDELSSILKLILELLPIIKPSDLQIVKNHIRKQERENEEKKKKLREAIFNNDVSTINALLFGE